MGLDVRLPIGAMFLILGLILALYGLMTGADAALYERSLSVNINLWWGVTMSVFGLVMLLLARYGARSAGQSASEVEGVRLATDTPEGRATEERERALGLEKTDS